MKRSSMVLLVLLVGLLLVAGCGGGAAGPGVENDYDEEIIFEIIDRSENEVVAYIHVDHWHGSLPEIPKGDNISLGAYIEDEDGNEIKLDGSHYSLGVDYAPGAAENVLSFDLHGDHIHIKGEQEGSAEVVFQLLHNDEVDYETPSIGVRVVQH